MVLGMGLGVSLDLGPVRMWVWVWIWSWVWVWFGVWVCFWIWVWLNQNENMKANVNCISARYAACVSLVYAPSSLPFSWAAVTRHLTVYSMYLWLTTALGWLVELLYSRINIHGLPLSVVERPGQNLGCVQKWWRLSWRIFNRFP